MKVIEIKHIKTLEKAILQGDIKLFSVGGNYLLGDKVIYKDDNNNIYFYECSATVNNCQLISVNNFKKLSLQGGA